MRGFWTLTLLIFFYDYVDLFLSYTQPTNFKKIAQFSTTFDKVNYSPGTIKVCRRRGEAFENKYATYLNSYSNDDIDEETDTIKDSDYGKPSIIPFDTPKATFAREDVPYQTKTISPKNDMKPSAPQIQKREQPSENIALASSDDERPTGYANSEEEDEANDVPTWSPTTSNDPYIIRLLKDLYIGSPYDSNARKQARSVVRNITAISAGIGIIFTAIWFLFPGQFISFRGSDEDFAAANSKRYSATYIEPDDLLNNEVASPDWEYFEEFSSVGKTNTEKIE